MNRLLIYILKRLGISVLLLIAISVIIFSIVQMMPGDVVNLMLRGISLQSLGQETVDELRKELGLGLPFHIQYFNWIKGVFRGDLGNSLIMKTPVAPIILHRLMNSLILAIPACGMMVIFGLTFGVLAAVKQNTWLDHIISFFTFTAISIPSFIVGLLFIYIFSIKLNLIPAVYSAVSFEHFSLWKKIGFFFSVLIFPTLTLSFDCVSYVSRQARASMIEELKTNYVRTAVLKGVPTRGVIIRHALKNALLPAITVMAFSFGYIIGGVVVVEAVFAYPGIGNLILIAINNRDLPLILGTMLVISSCYVLANLIADVMYTFFNPRIRY